MDVYEGKSETEHLIRQAAHELQISPVETVPALNEHIGSYSVKFKDRRGDAQEVFVPFDAAYPAIAELMRFTYKAKK
jgi:hypothetical protein